MGEAAEAVPPEWASAAVVPGSAEVGYAMKGNSAILVARQEVEVDCGGGFLKRFIVEEPIRP